MTGGTAAGYRQVLAFFRKDVEERLPLLKTVPEPGALLLFTTQVHALKSAAATIGAAEVSAAAARIEAAGNGGDLELIRKELPGFARLLADLAAAIRAMPEDVSRPLSPKAGFFDPLPQLKDLREALAARNTGAVDRLLEKLNQENLDPRIREALERISGEALMAEFEKAAALVEKLEVIGREPS